MSSSSSSSSVLTDPIALLEEAPDPWAGLEPPESDTEESDEELPPMVNLAEADITYLSKIVIYIIIQIPMCDIPFLDCLFF